METQTNIPKLRFPEFSGDWENKKLGEIILKLDSGVSVNSIDEPANELNEFGILKTSCISKGKFIPEQNKQILLEEIRRAKLNPIKGSIIISRMNTPQLVGESGYIEKDYPNLFVPDRLWMTSINVDKTNSKFLSKVISSIDFMSKISNIATGTSGSMKNISKPNFLNLETHFPNLSEQTKIATFLSAVDEKLSTLKQKKTLLEQYKKGVMQKIFSQELRFKDDNGNDFSDWEEKNGNLIFESISDKKHNSDLLILAITQEFGAIPRNLIDYTVSVTEKSIDSYKVVQIGDFIISLRSFQGGIEYSNYKGICSPAYIILRPHIEINNLFFKTYFKTDTYIKELQKNLEGIRDGKMISFKYFSDIKLPLPCLEEQTKIANFLSAIDEKISSCLALTEKMEVWKKGLLQQMFC
jgi:type I restriction enzyme S subunit